ncbi:NAD(P)-dependent oxidoreductase [Glaciibacter flavus]|uniref:NAD(P)-dependent oxidoreductase n=1 Tax=Orlajensenia flava TaxID=2565934 RepID=A0A4S4FVK2_9MICO|nr:NAD(P)-dependent oxidoreductase [Glaciibacter flavus]THG34348.1 NAD(P)-dependent oxidoreductase [Glaciibacter flavus]
MRVLLAGASGALGRQLVPQLLAAGHEVLGITRSPESADRLRSIGADAVVADVLDRDALLASLTGERADTVMHQLTALSKPPLFYGSMTATNVLREGGTAHLVEVAHLVGATRMVTQSIVLGYGFRRQHPAPVDESAPFGELEGTGADPTFAALVSAEQQVFTAQGIDGIALRYGILYGEDVRTVAAGLRRRMLPVTSWNGAIPFVHHADAASAAVAALDRGRPGTAYNVASEQRVSWREYVQTASRVLELPAPLRAPVGVLRAAAPYAGEFMTRIDLQVSAQQARDELGWEPRYGTVDDGLRQSRSLL